MNFFRAFLVLTFFLLAGEISAQHFEPVFLLAVMPAFPDDALVAVEKGGTIHMVLEVDTNGKAKVIDSFGPWRSCKDKDPRLDVLREAAIDAAKQSTYRPASSGGKKIKGMMVAMYDISPKTMPAESRPEPVAPTQGAIPMEPSKGGVINGRAKSLPKPSYPLTACWFGSHGRVRVHVIIDENGKVLTAEPRSGPTLLYTESAKAACGAKFTPTLLSGVPVKVSGTITYNFLL